MRYVIGLFVLALAVAVAMPAFAETQNVKVSGEITSAVIARDNLYSSDSLDKDTDKNNNFFFSTVAVEVAADLTDNVQTVVRLANQRDWNSSSSTTNEFDVNVDLAYVVLKEMIYAPLTLTIGRQDLSFGNGFIIGQNRIDPNSTISADEFTVFQAFDAIRATLDFNPWTIDMVYAKIDENTIILNDDVDLYGVNVGYQFDSYNGEAEAYYWYKHSSSISAGGSPAVNEADKISTVGIRGSMDPIENLTIGAEGAMQFGDYVTNSSTTNRDRKAWAFNGMAEYKFADYAWMPMLGGQYVYFSGNDVSNTSGDYKGWDSMYRSTVYGDIAEWIGSYYKTVTYSSGQDAIIGANSNRHIFNVYGSVKPMENVTLNAKYYHYRLAKKISATQTSKKLGDEVDLGLTWNYTDDVTFDLMGSIFWPGKTYAGSQDDTARQVVGKATVEF